MQNWNKNGEKSDAPKCARELNGSHQTLIMSEVVAKREAFGLNTVAATANSHSFIVKLNFHRDENKFVSTFKSQQCASKRRVVRAKETGS